MRRISPIALLCVMACALAVGGSALAVAKSHRHHGGSALAVAKSHRHAKSHRQEVKEAKKEAKKASQDVSQDKAAAQDDVTNPDSAAEAQKEQTEAQSEEIDKQAENQADEQEGDGAEQEGDNAEQEGDDAAEAQACKDQGVSTDNVEYDDQTGKCTAETGQGNGTDNSGSDTND